MKSLSHIKVIPDWLWNRPFMLVVLSTCLFCCGIWNAQDGYGEDTSPMIAAQACTKNQTLSDNLYVNCYIFLINGVSQDPVNAAVVIHFVSTFLSTIGVYLILTCFPRYLSKASVLFASLVWISATINAPILQSTCLSNFAFGVMCLAVYCLIRTWSIEGIAGFYVVGLTAASLRPEYMAPLGLVSLVLGVLSVRWILNFLQERFFLSPLKSRLIIGTVLAVGLVIFVVGNHRSIRDKARFCDGYLLFGFGQCYADFYRHEHPAEIFDPMTEYQWLLKRDFGDPHSFVSVFVNNPREAFRYFIENGYSNLVKIPGALLKVRDTGGDYNKRLSSIVDWTFRLAFVLWAIKSLVFSHRFTLSEIRGYLRKHYSLFGNLLVLVFLSSASYVSIFLHVGSPRYWITIAPLMYLLLAFSFQTVKEVFRLAQYERLIILMAVYFYCSPNFIAPHPNFEFRALQHIAPLVKATPTIGGWWVDPDDVFGFSGNASVIDVPALKWDDVRSGRVDILMIDNNLRNTRTWESEKADFEDFNSNPEKYGFKKVTDVPTGRFDIIYRPRS